VSVNGRLVHLIGTPNDVAPGGEVTFIFPFTFPKPPGPWEVELNLVEQNVAWFADHGVEPLTIVTQEDAGPREGLSQALQDARRLSGAIYSPTGDIARGRNGRAYPTVARRAEGCRVHDADGNQWIDYVMGWGSALLGYGNAQIRRAIAEELGGAAVLALPHELEVTVARMLSEMIPSAEMTVFGKNGSDVCTAGIRIAKLHTGRGKVLFSGYHGWQDPFASLSEPRLAPRSTGPDAYRFAPNDLGMFSRLIQEHGSDVAAVIIEPAAQVEGVDGPVRAADATFLAEVADLCRKCGAVLIFDEILTGFRHAGGSVQAATGVTPDLTCLGKALSAGMPLSALVGRRDLIQGNLRRAFYHPTYKGDVYSLAAARAALSVYQRDDVPAQIHSFGTRLMEGVNGISRELGLDGKLIGLPFRMAYAFREPEPTRRMLMRTLLHQELLGRGILTFRGFMLPSLAHGDAELTQTLEAFRAALRLVREAADADDFERHLEIAPVL
jgi:glutamate-1-semialdehyde aminotransferase